jgi:crotonobetainyl-CoA:carnitine CoA-transferase CaiB-like acyl-CoA transferase
MTAALSGCRVVELGSMIAAPYCGKLFGDLGADVVKAESRAGDPARREGPFLEERPDPETSALFLYLNTSKRGIVLDLEVAEDQETLRELVRNADVLITDRTAAELARLGLSPTQLAELAPQLVHCSLTSYGLVGPRAETPAGELTLIHAGGLANLLPTRCESTARAPVKMGGSQVGYHGALVGAMTAMAAYYDVRRGGRGRSIDVSLQDVIVAMTSPNVTGNRYQRTTWHRVPDRPPAMGRMEVGDGWVVLNAIDDHHFAELRRIMGEPDWCAGDQWLSLAYRANHLMDIADKLDAWARQQRKHALHELAGERRIPIGPIDSIPEVMESPQYQAREFFVEVEHPVAGTQRYPGWPYKLSASPARARLPAPRLDEHGPALRAEVARGDWRAARTSAPGAAAPTLPLPQPTLPPPTLPPPRLPLTGLRVLELCWVWAGPYAGAMLGSLGAEVIRVESHKRPDLMRRTVVWPLPDAKPTRVPSSQGMAFNSVNLNKSSITLDMATPQGRDIARELARKSDIVIDNMRPGALDGLGLGWDDLQRLKPELIIGSSSGRGRGGPHAEYLGYAMVHHGIGGGAHLTGYPDQPPSHSLGDVDLMNAVTLALAVLAAVHHRESTGEGQIIDFSQCEGVSALLGEQFLAYQLTGHEPQRMGNAHPRLAPHGVYPAWGVDRWLAIEVHSDEEYRRLTEVIDDPELSAPRFATMELRKANEAALDAGIERWTRPRDRDFMAHQLNQAGVRAAPSREGRDLYADPHLRARGTFASVEHPELGCLELVAPPFKLSDIEVPARCGPRLGEDTDRLLAEVLGLDAAAIEALRASDVIL